MITFSILQDHGNSQLHISPQMDGHNLEISIEQQDQNKECVFELKLEEVDMVIDALRAFQSRQHTKEIEMIVAAKSGVKIEQISNE